MAVRLDLAGGMHIGMPPDRVLGIDIRERCWANMAQAMREEPEWFPPAGLPAERDESGYRVYRLPLSVALEPGGAGEYTKMREIMIAPALNGWIAKVGCQTLVYASKDQMLKDLDEYLSDPHKKEKEFLKTAVNAKHTMGPRVDEPVADAAGDAPTGRPGVGQSADG